METSEILLQLITGGLLGLVGQILRFLVGYKKLYELASKEGVATADIFQTSRFIISLVIGFSAGVLGIVSLSEFKENIFSISTKETIMTLIGIGYAGTDFIEGFIKKYIPEDNFSQTKQQQQDHGNAPSPGASEQPQ